MLKLSSEINNQWHSVLKQEFSAPYFKDLEQFIIHEQKEFDIYPPENEIFNAFNCTPIEDVKVVLIGQDPYHGKAEAHGLSFSVRKGVKIPPSLRNIYKELNTDLNIMPPFHGDLTKWAHEGVLLLNATLTVRADTPGSHQKKGWEVFTNKVIEYLNEEKEHLVFILWGKYAQQKGEIINPNKHLIIQSAHPSPFAARKGFFGSQPFSKTNQYLKSKGITPIDWSLETW